MMTERNEYGARRTPDEVARRLKSVYNSVAAALGNGATEDEIQVAISEGLETTRAQLVRLYGTGSGQVAA